MNIKYLGRLKERPLNCYTNNRYRYKESVMRAVEINKGEEAESRLEKWTEKIMHDQFIWLIEEVQGEGIFEQGERKYAGHRTIPGY